MQNEVAPSEGRSPRVETEFAPENTLEVGCEGVDTQSVQMESILSQDTLPLLVQEGVVPRIQYSFLARKGTKNDDSDT